MIFNYHFHWDLKLQAFFSRFFNNNINIYYIQLFVYPTYYFKRMSHLIFIWNFVGRRERGRRIKESDWNFCFSLSSGFPLRNFEFKFLLGLHLYVSALLTVPFPFNVSQIVLSHHPLPRFKFRENHSFPTLHFLSKNSSADCFFFRSSSTTLRWFLHNFCHILGECTNHNCAR